MKFEPYPKYKDSRVEWIGEIPEEWEFHKINQIFEIIGSGTTPNSQNETYYENGVIPWVITGDLNNSTLNDTSKKISREAHRDHSTLKLYGKNSLIIAMYGATIGKISLLNLEACVNQACCVLANSKILVPKFAFYWFLANKSNIISLSYGGGQPNISQNTIKSLRIQVPTLLEQEQIIHFLDKKTSKIDLTIEKETSLIELLKEKRTALIDYVVTKGLDPTVKMKDSGVEWIGEIPAHWDVKKAKKIFIEINNRSRGKNEELLSVSHITGVTPRSEKPDITMFKAETTEGYKICEEEDLVINTMWAWMGAMGISKYKGVVSPSYNVYRFKVSGLNANYYDALFRTPNFTAEATRWSKGIWSSRLRLYPDGFFQIHLPIPPENEQLEIENLINQETKKINRLISTITKGISLLEEYKKSLIHHVVTGKVDVREVAV